MPPAYIHSVADFSSLITFGMTPESLFLDFKRTIKDWNVPKGTDAHVRQNAQKELCRDLAQFANTDGGCLLIGVDEEKNAGGIKVAKEIVRVGDPDIMRAWIEQAVTNYCVPSTFSRTINIIQVAGGPVIAINVLPSLSTVYIFSRDRERGSFEVVGRTNHGKSYLNPNELERHIMNGSRAARLSLERAQAASQGSTVVLGDAILFQSLKSWKPLKTKKHTYCG